MLAVDEDLRDRGAPAGAADHLCTPCRLLDEVDLGKGGALAFQQCTRTHAIRAEHCRVELDLSHCRPFPKIPEEKIMPRFAAPVPGSERRRRLLLRVSARGRTPLRSL